MNIHSAVNGLELLIRNPVCQQDVSDLIGYAYDSVQIRVVILKTAQPILLDVKIHTPAGDHFAGRPKELGPDTQGQRMGSMQMQNIESLFPTEPCHPISGHSIHFPMGAHRVARPRLFTAIPFQVRAGLADYGGPVSLALHALHQVGNLLLSTPPAEFSIDMQDT